MTEKGREINPINETVLIWYWLNIPYFLVCLMGLHSNKKATLIKDLLHPLCELPFKKVEFVKIYHQ